MRKTLIVIVITALVLLLSSTLMAQVVTVPKGTPIRLRLAETLQCENSHPGDSIAFEVTESIKIDGDTVIPEGALAYGRIADGTTPTRRVGHGGRVAFNLMYVTDATGREIPITEERYIEAEEEAPKSCYTRSPHRVHSGYSWRVTIQNFPRARRSS